MSFWAKKTRSGKIRAWLATHPGFHSAEAVVDGMGIVGVSERQAYKTTLTRMAKIDQVLKRGRAETSAFAALPAVSTSAKPNARIFSDWTLRLFPSEIGRRLGLRDEIAARLVNPEGWVTVRMSCRDWAQAEELIAATQKTYPGIAIERSDTPE